DPRRAFKAALRRQEEQADPARPRRCVSIRRVAARTRPAYSVTSAQPIRIMECLGDLPRFGRPNVRSGVLRAPVAFFTAIFARGLVILPLEGLVERRFRFVADSQRNLAETFVLFANEARSPLHPNTRDIPLRRFADNTSESHGERRA